LSLEIVSGVDFYIQEDFYPEELLSMNLVLNNFCLGF